MASFGPRPHAPAPTSTPLVSFYLWARTRTQTFHGSINLLPSVPETLRKIHWENARRCNVEGKEIICGPEPATAPTRMQKAPTQTSHLHTFGKEIKLHKYANVASNNFVADFFFFLPIPSYNHFFALAFLQFLFAAISGFFRLPFSATPPDYVFWPTSQGVDAKLCRYYPFFAHSQFCTFGRPGNWLCMSESSCFRPQTGASGACWLAGDSFNMLQK